MHGIETLKREDLVKNLNNMFEALSVTLNRVRDECGKCRHCSAEVGVRHEQSCAVWPLIIVKAEIVNAQFAGEQA